MTPKKPDPLEPTAAQMRAVLLQYGNRIREGNERQRKGIANTPRAVARYCRALKRVWNMAEGIAERAQRKAKKEKKPRPEPKPQTGEVDPFVKGILAKKEKKR